MRFSGGEGLFIGRGRRGINISYARPGQGGGRTMSVAKAKVKREVGAKSEEVI